MQCQGFVRKPTCRRSLLSRISVIWVCSFLDSLVVLGEGADEAKFAFQVFNITFGQERAIG